MKNFDNSRALFTMPMKPPSVETSQVCRDGAFLHPQTAAPTTGTGVVRMHAR